MNKQYIIWEGSKYIGTINYYESNKQFELILCGYFETYKFKNSKHLKKLLKRYSCSTINIPNDILEHIDCIAITNIL